MTTCMHNWLHLNGYFLSFVLLWAISRWLSMRIEPTGNGLPIHLNNHDFRRDVKKTHMSGWLFTSRSVQLLREIFKMVDTFRTNIIDICCCLPPDRTRYKVNDYSWDLGKGNVGHEPRLESCWSVLVIDPLSAMWV